MPVYYLLGIAAVALLAVAGVIALDRYRQKPEIAALQDSSISGPLGRNSHLQAFKNVCNILETVICFCPNCQSSALTDRTQGASQVRVKLECLSSYFVHNVYVIIIYHFHYLLFVFHFKFVFIIIFSNIFSF
jgi:hypothetical protein